MIKIDSRIKVFKFCLLNVCKREHGKFNGQPIRNSKNKGGGFEL
jgi:hypothetical protein